MRSRATPHEPAGGTITSSPGCQSAGVAMEKAADSPAKSLQFPAVAEIKEPKP